MYLYEKNKDKIDVYELKEKRDKLFEYKKREMEKLGKNNIVFNVLSNNIVDIYRFKESFSGFNQDKFINKCNHFFKHRKGLKISNLMYFYDNTVIVDGLLYQLYSGNYDYPGYNIKDIYDKTGDNIKQYLLLTTSEIKEEKTKLFNGESFKYRLPNIISIPESIYFLRKIIQYDFSDILDKNIDEQLSLFEFTNEPIKKLDLETAQFVDTNYVTDNRLELDQNILKKVRQINK